MRVLVSAVAATSIALLPAAGLAQQAADPNQSMMAVPAPAPVPAPPPAAAPAEQPAPPPEEKKEEECLLQLPYFSISLPRRGIACSTFFFAELRSVS